MPINKESRRHPQPALPIRLRDVFPSPAREFYDSTVPSNQQYEYEAGLHSIIRMGGLREKGFLLHPDFTESNLQHVAEVCRRATEYEKEYPVLAKFIDFSGRVQILAGVHDSGEIHPAIRDVQPVNRTPQEERRKRHEPWAARILVFSRIKDPVARDELVAYYKAYQVNDPRDLDVQMTQWLDKWEGTVKHADETFNSHALPDLKDQITSHLLHTMPRMMMPAVNLLTYLPTEEAREAMRNIVLSELDHLAKYAPKGVVTSFRKGFEPSTA